MCELVKCFNCNREDEPSEGMMPVDAETLFGELVNPDTEWYCSDCIEIGEQLRIEGTKGDNKMAEYRVTVRGTLVVDANTLEEAEKIASKCLVEEMYDYDVIDNIRSDGDYGNEESA